MTSKKQTAYERITEDFIKMLEKGVAPWRRPWKTLGGMPKNYISNRAYSGVNWFTLLNSGCSTPYYMTFKQAKEAGGNVMKGSKGFPVYFYTMFEKKDKGNVVLDSKGNSQKIPFLKSYTVFNLSQIEGIECPEIKDIEQINFNPIEACEKVMDRWPDKPEIIHSGEGASYSPSNDVIRMPYKNSFNSEEHYYSTLFHESGHATGHKSRLDRKLCVSYGSDPYGKEELIAEMTSAFLCAESRIDNEVKEESASYFQSWITTLKGDPKMLIQAASKAQKAADYILGKHEPKEL